MTSSSSTARSGKAPASKCGWGYSPFNVPGFSHEQDMDVRMEDLQLNAQDEAGPIDNQVQEDDAGELAPILNANERVFTREMLPANDRFTEQPVGDEYTEEFDAIIRRYDASGAPVQASLKHSENRFALFFTPCRPDRGSTSTCLFYSSRSSR